MPYQLQNKTYIQQFKNSPKDRLEVEIGDIKQPTFFPQIKIKRWDNEVNFSLRLLETEKGSPILSTDGNKIIWQKGDIETHFYDYPIGHADHPEGGHEFEVLLKKKPVSNILRFSLQTKGLDFFYQPPLTDEEIKEGSIRPENIVGSYAVYYKNCPANYVGGKEYKTGKVCHIPFPYLIDASGKKVRAEGFDITLSPTGDTGVMTIILPQAFLDSALYPILVDPTFGYTTVGSTSNGLAINYYGGVVYASGGAGTLTNLSFYTKRNGTSNTLIRLVIYNSDGSSLIDYSAEFTLTSTLQWYTQSITQGGSVNNSTSYFIGWWGGNPYGAAYYYDLVNANAYYKNSTYSASAPASSISPLTSWSTNKSISIYATYTASTTNAKSIQAKARLKTAGVAKTITAKGRTKILGTIKSIQAKARILVSGPWSDTWSVTNNTNAKSIQAKARLKTAGVAKTVTSKARVKQPNLFKTLQAKGRVKQANQAKTVTSKARVKVLGTTKTVTSKARLKTAGVAKTLTAKSRIKTSGVIKSITAKGRLKTAGVAKTLTAKSRIKTSGVIKTITAKGRVKTLGTAKTIQAKGRVKQANQAKTVTSKGRLKTAGVAKTVTSKARVKVLGTAKTIQAKGRIKQPNQAKTVTAKARVRKTLAPTIQAKASILSPTKQKSIQAKARVRKTLAPTIQARGRIAFTGGVQTIQAKARLKTADVAKTVTSKARVKQANRVKTITAKSRLKTAGVAKTLTAKGRIVYSTPKTIQSKARVKSADIAKSIQAKGRIKQANLSQTITAKGRLKTADVAKTVTSKATIRRTYVPTITAKSRIRLAGIIKTLTARARIWAPRSGYIDLRAIDQQYQKTVGSDAVLGLKSIDQIYQKDFAGDKVIELREKEYPLSLQNAKIIL